MLGFLLCAQLKINLNVPLMVSIHGLPACTAKRVLRTVQLHVQNLYFLTPLQP